MSVETNTPEPHRISRRTLAAGAAWAAPAVAVAAAAPAYAKSGITTTTTTLPPCVGGVVNLSSNWEVDGAQYAGCNCSDHRDVRLKFTVTSTNCPYTTVKIRVKNVDDTKSKWCWSGTNDWLTKTATLVGGVWTYPVQRLTQAGNANDGLYFPAYSTGGVRDDLGSCYGDYYVGTNDGMHINPCEDGPYFQYQVSTDDGLTWSPVAYWGYRADVPLPQGCSPVTKPVLSLVSNSCTTVGTDTRTVTVSWTGTANRLQRATNSTFQNSTTTTVSGNSHSYSFTDSNCDTQYYFRVYQNGTTNYSNTVMSASGAGTQSLSAEEQSLQEQSVSSSEARVTETTTTTEAPTTTTTTAAPTTTTSTTAAPETTETPTDG